MHQSSSVCADTDHQHSTAIAGFMLLSIKTEMFQCHFFPSRNRFQHQCIKKNKDIIAAANLACMFCYECGKSFTSCLLATCAGKNLLSCLQVCRMLLGCSSVPFLINKLRGVGSARRLADTRSSGLGRIRGRWQYWNHGDDPEEFLTVRNTDFYCSGVDRHVDHYGQYPSGVEVLESREKKSDRSIPGRNSFISVKFLIWWKSKCLLLLLLKSKVQSKSTVIVRTKFLCLRTSASPFCSPLSD